MILAPFAPRTFAPPWRDFIEALDDAVLVFDTRARVVQANPASRSWVAIEPGTALADLDALLGPVAVRWLGMAIARRGAPPGPPPSLRLPGGAVITLACSRLDDRHCAVRLGRPGGAVAPDTSAAAAPPAGEAARQQDLVAPALAHAFDVVPVALLVFDATGAVLRANAAWRAWLGSPAPRLDDAPAAVQALLGWGEGGLHADPGSTASLRTLVVGAARLLRARVHADPTPGVPRRYLAVVEDSSVEAERDLAQMQVGAMMDAAGVGVATYPAAEGGGAVRTVGSGAGRAVSGDLAHIGRGLVSPASMAEYDRLQVALREGRPAQARYEIHHPDHGSRWLLTRVEPAVLASGGRTTSVVTLDVTEQQRGQAQSRQLLHELEVLGRDRELMFSLSEVGIAFLRERSVQRANEAMADLTGWSVTELATLDLSQLSADAQAFEHEQAEEARAIAQHGRWRGEHQLRRRDGRLVWVQVSKRPVKRDHPAEGLIASYVDVDARHRAERAVALQAERTRSILDSALVGIVNVGPQGIEWMNRSARRMFGGTMAEFLGSAMSCVATPEADHPFRRTQYLDELVEGQAQTFECRLRARDGREFWVVGNAVATDRERGGRQLTYALLDIERRRQAEARMSEAQVALQQVISAAPLAIALLDARAFEILQVNEVAAAALHASAERLVGRTPERIFAPRLAALRSADLRAALEGRLASSEFRIRKARGAPARVWDARYVPLSRAAGLPPDRLLLVATDVTEQRAAQDARLAAAIEQREMLVREVHHRIKNNLQGVAGLLQQIAERKAEVAAIISEVVGQVQAIAHVHGLQVGAGGELRVAGVVQAIGGSVQRTFGQPIACRLCGTAPGEWGLPEAEAIPVALIVNELLTNAVKHGQGHGNGTSEEIACEVLGDASGVRIVVSNDGRLPAGFSLGDPRGSVSGLGLVRALLPRRHAALAVEQQGLRVVATVTLHPPVVAMPAGPAVATTMAGGSGASVERAS